MATDTIEKSTTTTAPLALTDTSPSPDDDPSDVDYGWAMFYLFTTSVLAISFAVCALAMSPSWWTLGAVFGTDLFVTAMVLKVVLGAFTSPSYPDVEGAGNTSAAVARVATRRSRP